MSSSNNELTHGSKGGGDGGISRVLAKTPCHYLIKQKQQRFLVSDHNVWLDNDHFSFKMMCTFEMME